MEWSALRRSQTCREPTLDRTSLNSQFSIRASRPEIAASCVEISSIVAGSRRGTILPAAMLASACFTAAQTEIASSSGGSPTALLPLMFTVFVSLSIHAMLKISGRSWMFGIL